jgi:general secretion pathway protein D
MMHATTENKAEHRMQKKKGGLMPRHDNRGWFTGRARRTLRWSTAALACAGAVAGCAIYHPTLPPPQGHITQQSVARATPPATIPPPARTSNFLPPPKPAARPRTYSVVVNDVPVKELLQALARDTKQNIDIHPALSGVVSINAVNQTLPAILDRIGQQVSMRWRREGSTIVVRPDTPYMKTYHVNYVNMTRKMSSTVGVSGQIAGAVADTQNAQQNSDLNSSSTTVKTISDNDFWGRLRENIQNILASTQALTQSTEEKVARLQAIKAQREAQRAQVEAVSRAGQTAPQLYKEAFHAEQQPSLPGGVKDDIIINPIAGTVSVLATEKQHKLIQQLLDNISRAVQRQVLIEATVVEVQLSNQYQGGIDWSRLPISGGLSITQSLLGANLNQAPFASIGYTNSTSSVGNVNALIKLLSQFGNTQVLSSPKLMALNNQTAILKVVDNIVYFSVQASTNQNQTNSLTTFNTTAHTVPVGVIMTLTPQINANGNVTLTVRPTISRILDFKQDPNPNLIVNGQIISNLVPEIQVREMESVLQIASGQTAVMGGLMEDTVKRDSTGVPVIENAPGVGELFKYRNEQASKNELVIFLRPTVIKNPSLASDELKDFQRFLPNPQTFDTP